MGRKWRAVKYELDVFSRVHVMGIVNVTPDSFSDGGELLDPKAAVDHALGLIEAGADIIDIGGESTRPGADSVDADEEIQRVIPVISALAPKVSVPISIDTTKASVAKAAISEGASVVNDISGLRADPSMAAVIAETQAGVVLMHMQGEPRTMQLDPVYSDVVSEVRAWLLDRVQAAQEAGIERERIVIDPGIGFGKTREHNLALLRWLTAFASTDLPVMVGPSRKSFIGATLDVPVGERLEGTAAAVAWCVTHGANIVRVHDVREMVRVVRMTEAIQET